MKKLNPVIPIVFYHGQKKWRLPLTFLEIFSFSPEEKELFKPFLPSFQYSLMDINEAELSRFTIPISIDTSTGLSTCFDRSIPISNDFVRIYKIMPGIPIRVDKVHPIRVR